MPRVLVTGGAGLAGQALLRSKPVDIEARATWRNSPLVIGEGPRIDLCDSVAVGTAFANFTPDVVLHTAYTQSDRADIVDATANVASAAAACGARLIHLSSDLVFGGEQAPYAEDPLGDGADAPVDDYGRWKAEGEAAVTDLVPDAAVVRTSLLVDLVNLDPRTASIIEGLQAGTPVNLFVDEVRSPLSVDDFAAGLWRLVALERGAAAGVWHLGGTEGLSRYSLGVLAAASWGLDPAGITPTRQSDHPAPRARDVRLRISRAERDLDFRPRTMAELFTTKPH